MAEESKSLPGYNSDYHFPRGTTVNFANKIVIGSCYSFEPGEELQCRQCGSKDIRDIVREGPIRCDDGPVAADAGLTMCNACQSGYIWRICTG